MWKRKGKLHSQALIRTVGNSSRLNKSCNQRAEPSFERAMRDRLIKSSPAEHTVVTNIKLKHRLNDLLNKKKREAGWRWLMAMYGVYMCLMCLYTFDGASFALCQCFVNLHQLYTHGNLKPQTELTWTATVQLSTTNFSLPKRTSKHTFVFGRIVHRAKSEGHYE